MAPELVTKKRKAITRDAPEADEVVLSDGGEVFDSALLKGFHSDEVDDSEDDEGENSDQITGESDLEQDGGGSEGDIASDEVTSDEEDGPVAKHSMNYEVTEDANGEPRYIYEEIETGYASDDSDAPVTTNTIGNIPLSFYDSYPHIGYTINGKKITRPAKGEALDALLDTIEVPKG